MITSFENLYDKVSVDGTYFVEDMHTSYWPSFGGGLRNDGTFIEYSKNLIDKLNVSHAKEIGVSEFSKTTTSISFYDSIVVFEKAPQGRRQHLVTEPFG